jgi:predicted AAA+ superfamily ATPase
MIKRQSYMHRLEDVFSVHPICGLLGPRQCGKSTLAKMFVKENIHSKVHYFDLEDPLDLANLEMPQLSLDPLEGFIIIDEVQRRPDLFPYLRVFVDKYPERKILILGSASQDLLRQSSETLAGRIRYVELTPFTLFETKNSPLLWLRGGFPRSYLAQDDAKSLDWRKGFIRTFLERDVNQLGFNVSAYDLRRLWTMLAHYHGNVLNYSELARSMGVSDNTIRKYVHLLQGTFMVRLLKPWHENIQKRQIRTPKIYLRDSGILHALLDINDDLIRHPKVGASWEGFALEELIRHFSAEDEECYFWSTQSHAELDLLIIKGGQRRGFEFKYTDRPKVTRSMQIALDELKLDQITVIIPGNKHFFLTQKIEVKGIDYFAEEQSSLQIRT